MLTIHTPDTRVAPPDALPISTTAPVGARYYWHVRSCVELQCSEPSPTRVLNLGRSDHDLNGDGFADIIIRSPGAVTSANIYFGGRTLDPQPAGTLSAPLSNSIFGLAIAYAGDVNNDGFGDLIVGTPSGAGTASIYFGGPGARFDTAADVVMHGEADGDNFGQAVDGAGDVDGDGYADVIVGAAQSNRLDAHEVCAHPRDPRCVIAATGAGLCISRDAGHSWTLERRGLHAVHCASVGFVGDDLLVGCASEQFAPDGAVHRRPIASDEPLARVPGLPEWTDGIVDTRGISAPSASAALVDRRQRYGSTDAGRSWSRHAAGFPAPSGVLVLEA